MPLPVCGMLARLTRHHVVVTKRTSYVVDTARLSGGERVDACRGVLSVVAEDITSFETDIPWSAASEWPADVRQAAEFLSCLKEPSRGEDALYRRTGEVRVSDPGCWEAFVDFAPYAYDASAWGDGGTQIVALSDAADSIVATLTATQAAAVGDAVGQDVLVPLKECRRRRH
jgi:hypothetical protein